MDNFKEKKGNKTFIGLRFLKVDLVFFSLCKQSDIITILITINPNYTRARYDFV
jgi:hypothetical protein